MATREGLRISADLTLPVDYITKTGAILAQRRKGKTYTASVIAEEFVYNTLPFVVLDPTGAWWGLRAMADAKKAGLPVVVIGGQHGDLPLERGAGRLIADLVVDRPGYYVIDFSLFESNEAEREFATAFAERLYRRKGQAGMDFPMHLFVDEADRFVPQRVPSGDQRMLGAFEAIVRRGGLRGLGTTLISQRAAVVNKNVLEQLDILVILRTVGPNDRKAIKEYVESHGTAEQIADIVGSMSSLGLGEAFVWEPGADPSLFERVQIRERHTFNSSATPKVGEARVVPERLAEVDLDFLRGAMADLVERAEAEDPKFLRRRIKQLEREVAAAQADQPAPEPELVPVPEPYVPEAVFAGLDEIERAIHTAVHTLEEALLTVRGVREDGQELRRPTGHSNGTLARTEPASKSRTRRSPAPAAATRKDTRKAAPPPVDGDVVIKAGARRMVEVLGRVHPLRLTRAQIATMAKMKVTGGTFGTYWSVIKRAGLIDEAGDDVGLTEAGLAFVGIDDLEPMTAGEVQEMWRSALKAGARKMLDVLIDAYPNAVTRDELAAAVDMEPTGGTFGTYLSTLRRNGLIDVDGQDVTASETLFIGVA